MCLFECSSLCLVKLYVTANNQFKKMLESVTDVSDNFFHECCCIEKRKELKKPLNKKSNLCLQEQKQALNDLQQAILDCIVN